MDSARVYKWLMEGGFSKEVSLHIVDAMGASDPNLATKQELKDMEAALKADLKDLKISLLKELNQMTFKILGGIAVIVTFIGTVFKFLEH